ncbi:caspase family protein [Kitasatospora sp. NPDC058162]|uniref:caspase family protein n=1 Tax=Kitasatospora sp. NPDC058162 TaxID=3346362 RepID=UPI0036DB4E6E
MGRFSALLIGAADYGRDSLPFVHQDLASLGKALEARGADVWLPRPRAGGQVTANFVNGEVGDFLARAVPGERLVICLSGHGTHVDGQDYLVPEDIHPQQRPYWSGCIAIDWKQGLQETAAAQVLFLIDACRQGIRDSMGPPPGWSPSKMRAVASRRVARLYACAPGELARFVPAEDSTAGSADGSFSLFSRAVREVLVSHEGPLHLDELRAGVQQRVNALHREHRKGGRPQEVRVLTEAVHTEFVVVGELKALTTPAAARVEGEPEPQLGPELRPVAKAPAKDPAKLMADALHQVLTTGRTEYLEEFAVVGPTSGLLTLSGVAELGTAVDAMWTAAARRRPVGPLVELTGALHGSARPELALLLVELASVARPVGELPALLAATGLPPESAGLLRAAVAGMAGGLPASELVALVRGLHDVGLAAEADQVLEARRSPAGLPELLDALEAADLRSEADRLVQQAAATDELSAMEQLLALLAEAGRDAHRVAVLTAIASGPMDRLVAWLAIGPSAIGPSASRVGLDEDVALVLRFAVTRRPDGHLILPALRRTGRDGQLRTVLEEAAHLEPRALHGLVKRLHEEGAEEDATAVTQCAVEPFRPVDAAGLAVLLRRDGLSDLLPLVLTALCRAGVDEVEAFLRAAQEGGDGDLLGQAVPMLAERHPVAGLNLLGVMLEGHRLPGTVWHLWWDGLAHRPLADLLTTLEGAGFNEQHAILERVARSRRPAAELAELVELPGRPALRERIGAQLVACLADGDDKVLKEVLAVLLDRGWDSGISLLIGRIAYRWSERQLVWLTVWLEGGGHGQQARALLDRKCGENYSLLLAPLAEELLVGRYPQFGRHLLDGAARRWSIPDVARLAEQLASPQGAAHLLTRTVELRTSVEVADLLFALDADAEPSSGPLPVHQLLDRYLTAGSPEEAVRRIVHLREARPGGRVAQGVSKAVWANAAELFQAAGRLGATECLLAACGNGAPVRPLALHGLLAELRRDGSRPVADLVRDTAVRTQPPDAVAAFLMMFQVGTWDDFDAACRALGDRPVREVVKVLASPYGTRSAAEACVVRYAQAVDADRCRAVLYGLFRRGDDQLGTALLGAAPWTGSGSAVGGLFLDLDRRSPPQGQALRSLARSLEAAQAVELIEHVVQGGASPQLVTDIMEMLAGSTNASATWTRLQALGRYMLAAALLHHAWRTEVVVTWYRDLLASPVEIDWAAVLAALGADRPIPEIVASPVRFRARLATAVLFRLPPDAADLLTRTADLGDVNLPEQLRRLLAAARPAPELAATLRILTNRGQREEAVWIVDALLAHEPTARLGALLEAAPWPHGPAYVPEPARLVARTTMGTGATAALIRKLLEAEHPRAAELLLDELASSETGASDAVRLLVQLAGERVGPELRDRLTEGFCVIRSSEHVGRFLHLLGRTRLPEDQAMAIAVVADTRRADLDAIRSVLTAEGNDTILHRLAVATGDADTDSLPRSRWFRRKH